MYWLKEAAAFRKVLVGFGLVLIAWLPNDTKNCLARVLGEGIPCAAGRVKKGER
jgi:hypothetical protein